VTPDVEQVLAGLAELVPSARAPGVRRTVVRAPGRVNLIGEHTDYNAGLALPVAIDLEIVIAFVPAADRRVEITLLDGGERAGFDLDAIGPATGTWIDYVAGTALVLERSGAPLRGLRGVLASTLPISAGLSSSAALELASAWALGGGEAPLDALPLARAAQRAENVYVGVNCGLMDQLAATVGSEAGALLVDFQELAWRAVPLPLKHHALVVCDSGSPRRLGTSQYNARRAQCEVVVEAARVLEPAVRALRDVDRRLLARLRGRVDASALRCAEHVVGENERVVACVEAFERGDLEGVGRLFAESHASLRDLYEVSSPELDALVEIAGSVEGVAAARLTGAGFGGCTVNLVARDRVDALAAAVTDRYPARTGLQPTVYRVEPAPGAGRVPR
jgi:galactokinase